MDKLLEVKYGTIYTKQGTGIDNMAVIIDKEAGLMKYGDAERGMDKCYDDMLSKYKQAGLEDMCEDIVYIKFDRYNGILTIEDICTLVNYMLMCSANGSKIMTLFNMENEELKSEIVKLRDIGY